MINFDQIIGSIIGSKKRKRSKSRNSSDGESKKRRRKLFCLPPGSPDLKPELKPVHKKFEDDQISLVSFQPGNSPNVIRDPETISISNFDAAAKEKYLERLSKIDATVFRKSSEKSPEPEYEDTPSLVQQETQKLIDSVRKRSTAKFYENNSILSDWTKNANKLYGYKQRSLVTRCAGDNRDAELTERLEESHETSIIEAVSDPLELKRKCDITLRISIPEFTEEMCERISSALSGGRTPTSPVAEFERNQCTATDLRTLNGLNWLNDEVINYYLQLIQRRSENDSSLPIVYSFNTFLYPRLQEKGHSGVKRWTRKVNIFEFDILLIPIHLGMHWCMAYVDVRKKLIRYLDSLGGSNLQCRLTLIEYLKAEHLNKFGNELSSDWRHESCSNVIPHQQNSSDCGVFSLKFADYLSRDLYPGFTQEKMPRIRKIIQFEILTNNLIC